MTDKDVEKLPDDPATLKAALKLAFREINTLELRVGMLLKKQYSRKSEKLPPNYPSLFDLAEEEQAPAEVDDASEAIAETPAPAKRTGHGRRKLPANLPRERVEYRVPTEKRNCVTCGQERKSIGWRVSEQLEYVPGSFRVIEHAQESLACPCCKAAVEVATKPAQPIDKGMGGPGLYAALTVSKFGDHLPYYRLEEVLQRSGFHLSRATQSEWLIRLGDLVNPLVQLIKQRVLLSFAIWTDDTTLPVLDPPEQQTKTGRVWVYIGDLAHRYAVFDYTDDRKGRRPREFLGNFSGYLHADAYGGYDQLYERGPVREVACWAHARRKFHDAISGARAGATYALGMIQKLYHLEQQMSQLDNETRRERRQALSIPLLTQIKSWLDEQVKTLLPKAALAPAVNYALNQWEALCRYTEHGGLSIDNNLSERTLRAVAIGRKNYLFAGSDRGARAAANHYSLISTCKLLGIDPYRYLRAIYSALPELDPQELPSLLPDQWFLKNPEAKLVERRK